MSETNMAMEVNYLMRCCGIKEINGLSYHHTSQNAMLEFCRVIYPTEAENRDKWKYALEQQRKSKPGECIHFFTGGQSTGATYEEIEQYSRFRFGIFSEAVAPMALSEKRTGPHYEYGRMFAKFIQDNNLGSLVTTENHELNPNSGAMVKVWVWGIDHDALKAWYKKNLKEEPWAQKPMSAVIANAVPADNFIGSLQTGSGTTIVSVDSGQSLSNASPTLGSRLRNAIRR